MCDFCKKDTGVDYKLVGKTIVEICPNCVASNLCNGNMFFPEGKEGISSELSGNRKAIEIYPCEEKQPFVLDQSESKRFLAHQLMPNEYLKLLDNHSPNEFDLHDDFYSRSGLAYQPLLEDMYFEQLKKYSNDYNDINAKLYSEYFKDTEYLEDR